MLRGICLILCKCWGNILEVVKFVNGQQTLTILFDHFINLFFDCWRLKLVWKSMMSWILCKLVRDPKTSTNFAKTCSCLSWHKFGKNSCVQFDHNTASRTSPDDSIKFWLKYFPLQLGKSKHFPAPITCDISVRLSQRKVPNFAPPIKFIQTFN